MSASVPAPEAASGEMVVAAATQLSSALEVETIRTDGEPKSDSDGLCVDDETQLVPDSSFSSEPIESTATASGALLVSEQDEEDGRPDFDMGDHVYQWCNAAGGLLPAAYAHHGIVLDVIRVVPEDDSGPDNETDQEKVSEPQWLLHIADFSDWQEGDDKDKDEKLQSAPPRRKKSLLPRSRSSSENISEGGCIRTYKVDHKSWHKVQYSQTGFWKRSLSRAGTCTAARCDGPAMVRARVQFLQDYGTEILPRYHVVESNCECVAVWCMTGTFCTLQASSWLHLTAAGQAKSAVTLASAAASTQVTVPAAGLWGWLGYTTHVSLLSTQPYLLPAIATYGVVTVGVPALCLLHAKKRWKELTIQLNEAFWNAAVEHPDIFVDNIVYWSGNE